MPTGNELEIRGRDAVPGKHLLGQHLVARQHEPAGIAARVRLPHELEIGDDVVVIRRDALELLEQVEDHVWLPLADHVSQLGQLIAYADHADLVPKVAERSVDVIFGTELRRSLRR